MLRRRRPVRSGPGAREDRGPGAARPVVPVASSAPAPVAPAARLDAGAATTARWTLRGLIIAAGLALLAWVVGQLWSIVLPVLLALLLSTVLRPPARLLARVLPDALAALVTVVGLLGLVVVVGWVLAARVVNQVSGLSLQVSAGLEQVQQALDGASFDGAPPLLEAVVDRAIDQVQQNAGRITSTAVNGIVTGVVGVGSLLVTAALTLVLASFVVKDGSKFQPWAHRWCGARAARHLHELGGRVWDALGGFIWSQAAVSAVDAVFIGAGLVLLDIPFAIVLTVLTFAAGFVPIVGAITAGALAVLIALVSHGFWTAVAVLATVLVVQQLESNLLQPVLVGRVLALHPVVVLSAVTVGGTAAGILGAFLAVPVVAVAVVALRDLREVLRDGPSGTTGEVEVRALPPRGVLG